MSFEMFDDGIGNSTYSNYSALIAFINYKLLPIAHYNMFYNML